MDCNKWLFFEKLFCMVVLDKWLGTSIDKTYFKEVVHPLKA